jgi:predicted CopG family antitoxin
MKRFRTIKVSEDVYEDLKRMGIGISRALEIIVKSQRSVIESKMGEIERSANEIARLMLERGFFDIRLRGVGVSSVEEQDDSLIVYGYCKISIPDGDLRSKIKNVLEGNVGAE